MAKTENKHNTNQGKDAAKGGVGRKPTTRKASKQVKTSKPASSAKRAASVNGKTGASAKSRSGEIPPQLSSKKYSVASRNAAQRPASGYSGRTGSAGSTRSQSIKSTQSLNTSTLKTKPHTRGIPASKVQASGLRPIAKGNTSAMRSSAQNAKRQSLKGANGNGKDGTFKRIVNIIRTYPKVAVPILLVIVVVLGYCIVDITASLGKIHPGVRVQGVDVGGMTIEDASTKLNESLTPQLSEAQITLYENADIAAADGVVIESNSGIEKAYAEQTSGSDVNDDGVTDKWVVTADTIGAYIDGNALAQEAFRVGREGNIIADRFGAWFGGKSIDATVAVSYERFNTLMAEINAAIGKSIVDSTLEINNGKVGVIPGSDGRSVEQPKFIQSFSHAVFNPAKPYCTIPMQTDSMHISVATAQRVADEVRSTIVSDVKIVYNADTWTMNSTDLGNVISASVLQPDTVLVFGSSTQKVEPLSTVGYSPYDTSVGTDPNSGYTLQAYVDQGKMDAYLVGILGEAAKGGAQNASFDTSSGEVVIVESVDGNGPDRAAAELALQDMLFGTQTGELADRTITLVDTTVRPEFTTEMAQSMGIKERLATWTIPLSGSSERIGNIQLLCSLINNCLVAQIGRAHV